MRKYCRPALVVVAWLCSPCIPAVAAEQAEEGESAVQSAAPIPGNPEFAIDTVGLKYGCFYAREVGNWEALNTDYLIAYAPNKNRAFLVRFGPPSFELRSAATIAFAGRDRICGRPGERLLIGTNINSARMPYGILDVWQLDALAVERLLAHKKGRDSAHAEAAGTSPGAVVETDIKVNGDAAAGGDSGVTDAD